VTVSYSEVSGDSLPAWYAADMGVFQKHNLDVDLKLIDSSTSVAALLAGETQIALVGGSSVMSAAAGGADLQVVAMLSPVPPYVFEVAQGINSVDDLRDKKVGVSQPGSSSDIITRIALKALGLEPDKDVAIVSVGSSQNRTSAMISGAIQGALAHPPENLKMEQAGTHQLVDISTLNVPSANTGAAVQRAWANSHREAMQAFVDSLVEATARLKQDEPGTATVIQHYYKLEDAQQVKVTYDYHVQHILPTLPYPRPEQFQSAVSILSDKNPAIASYDVTKLLDPSYVQSAADRGLDKL
jgi:NitT/TauT family transport system substrate-binding protein